MSRRANRKSTLVNRKLASQRLLTSSPTNYKLRVSYGFVAVTFPPIQAADQFFDAKSQPGQIERAFGRSVAPDAIAVNHVQRRTIERLHGTGKKVVAFSEEVFRSEAEARADGERAYDCEHDAGQR